MGAELKNVGGQAVLEGVMMRSPKALAIAVRRPQGDIVVLDKPWISLWDKFKFLKWPFFRGGVVFLEALQNGMSALSFSAKHGAEMEEGEEEPSKAALTMTLVISLVLGFGLFAGLPHLLSWLFGYFTGVESIEDGQSLPFHLIDGVFKIAIFVTYLALISRLEEIRRVFQYHGAEHKTIFTYEAGEPLDVAHASRHKKEHPRCGTAFLVFVIMVSIVIFTVVFPFMPKPTDSTFLNQLIFIGIKLPLMFPVAGISYEITRLAGKHPDSIWLKPLLGPGLAMQRITTKEPTADMLEVALASLRVVLHLEKVGQDASEQEIVYEDFDALVQALDGDAPTPEAAPAVAPSGATPATSEAS